MRSLLAFFLRGSGTVGQWMLVLGGEGPNWEGQIDYRATLVAVGGSSGV